MTTERWLRGPVEGVPAALQPVAHALLQALDEIEGVASGLDRRTLWRSSGSAAPVGFHLRHLAGSIDRLMTYARGEALSESQRAGLASEKAHDSELGASHLGRGLRAEVEKALEQLRRTSDGELDESRSVGRAGLPSTVRGLLYHVGEHAARHAGQVVTTVRTLEGQSSTSPD